MYLKLIRKPAEGKSVRGTLYQVKHDNSGNESLTPICSTLENSDYLILPLIYKLSVTYSPKFKRPLPLVNDVPKAIASSSSAGTHQLPEQGTRSGIRFHPGSKPEHSRGCILVAREMEKKLSELILSEREVRLEIN